MADNTENNFNNNNILKELSDIKNSLSITTTSLAVNTTETRSIKETIKDIQSDVKEMKKNYITQEQHRTIVESVADHENRLRSNEASITKIMTFGSAFVILIGILEFVIQLVFLKK